MLTVPSDSCLTLLEHCMRAAASRTFWTAGNSRPMSTAMMAMTTSSSISVKPRRERERRVTVIPTKWRMKDETLDESGGRLVPGGERRLLQLLIAQTNDVPHLQD